MPDPKSERPPQQAQAQAPVQGQAQQPQHATRESERSTAGGPEAGALRAVSSPSPTPPSAAPSGRETESPYTGPSEMVRGGRYIQGGSLRGETHYGGRIVNAQGEVLATFGDDQVNTGDPADGTPTKKG